LAIITFVTWLWQDDGYRWNGHYRLGPAHVNRLHQALDATQTGDWRLVCLTDASARDIDPAITVLPVPAEHAGLGRCWRRLWLFSAEAAEFGERLVQLDLDAMILGDLTPLFDNPPDFVAWRPYNHYCGSMWMLKAGAHTEVWDSFGPATSPDLVTGFGGSDQAWVRHVLGPDQPVWTAADGLYSYRKHFHGLSSGSFWEPPEDCRAIFFHGPFDPSMPSVQARHPWVGDYWRATA